MTPPSSHSPLRLRAARPEDAAALLEIYAPIVRETAISFEHAPPSEAELAAKVREVSPTHPWIVAERGGALLGYAYATRFRGRAAYDWSCESSVYVATGARRQGLGLRLGAALVEALEAQGFRTVVAGIALPNEASRELHRRLGYRAVGTFAAVGFKLGRFHDVEFWERRLGAGTPPEAPPAPFDAESWGAAN